MRCSIELAVGTPLDPLIFFVLRGSWSFVELTRRLNTRSSVLTLDRVFKRSIKRLNARSSV
ncbi:hypothetical protein PGT21_016714 [Puccinia graminis f. sp. tritici]|uniref:Uncharacterized protein n=1 Tax=Puccinia graminis f. sp. tritici TaxID=56615 RepID=A0A5B0N7G4_PUCGR|nr:hypothetical protein PGT21_016714 [Puccinia graminis f. sp. tritici]